MDNGEHKTMALGAGWLRTAPLILGVTLGSLFSHTCAQASPYHLATSATPSPGKHFLKEMLLLPYPSDYGMPVGPERTDVTIMDFVSQLAPGNWVRDDADGRLWIYRIHSYDRLTQTRRVLSLLFARIASGRVELSQLAVNGQLLPPSQIFLMASPIVRKAHAFAQAWNAEMKRAEGLGSMVHTRFGVVAVDKNATLTVNGEPVKPTVQGNSSLTLEKVFQLNDRDLVLVQDDGGQACPALYYIVILRRMNATTFGSFGTCAEYISAEQNGQSITMKLPGYSGPFEGQSSRAKSSRTIETFVYANGRMTEDGKSVRPGPGY